jgi:uncharacterized delta-60 repeat protein
MSAFSWLRPLATRLHRTRARRGPQRPAFRPRLETLEDRLTPSTGGLPDPTFGSGGTVISSNPNNYEQADAVVAQPDGKIVIGGNITPGYDYLVARYNADGTPDTSFGSGGYTVTAISGAGAYGAEAVALQPQAGGTSKILAAGFSTVTTVGRNHKITSSISGFAVTRYNANGTLDTTFGSNGEVFTSGQGSYVGGMVVDGSGRIVVAEGGTLVRYTPNGALDTSFGSGGMLVTSIPIGSSHSIALQPDGKIVLAGTQTDPVSGSNEYVVARFNANGTADSTFGNGGVVTTRAGGGNVGVTIQGDGKIVVCGNDAGPPSLHYLLRYNADGSLDATFGTGGIVSFPNPAGGASRVGEVVVQADGKIIVGTYVTDAVPNSAQFFGAFRVKSDGSVDTGYGNGGWALVEMSPGAQEHAMALEPDGRLVLAGYTQPNNPNPPVEVALVRFLGSAPQVGSFTASPNAVATGNLVTLTASSITYGNPNSTVTQVAFYVDSNGDGKLDSGDTLLGYATQTSPGVWTYSFTVNLTTGTYTLFAQAQDNYGALGDPLALALQVQ